MAPQLNPMDLVDAIGEAIKVKTGVPSFFGAKSSNTVKSRYNWEPGSIAFSDVTDHGVYPRRLHDAGFNFDVYCRAPSWVEAVALIEQLVTSTREIMKGGSYTLGDAQLVDGSGESSTAGWSYVVPMTLKAGLFEADDEETYTTVRVTDVAFDQTNADPDDGELIAPLG